MSTIRQGRRALKLASAAALVIPLLAQAPAVSAQGAAAPARPKLFDLGTAADLALDAQQAAKLARYRADPAAASVTVVRVATDRLPGPDQVQLDLGGRPSVLLDRRGLTERSPRAYSWHGRSAAAAGGNPRDVSEASLVVDGEFGRRHDPLAGRALPHPTPGRGLLRPDPGRREPHAAEHPPGFDRPPVAPDDGPQRDGGTAADDDCGTYNLMVAYTASARAQAGDIDGLIQLAVDETNNGYAASGVGTRVNLVHRYQTPYADFGDLGTDLSRITSKTDGAGDEVHALRNEYAADVSILLTGRGNYCGRRLALPRRRERLRRGRRELRRRLLLVRARDRAHPGGAPQPRDRLRDDTLRLRPRLLLPAGPLAHDHVLRLPRRVRAAEPLVEPDQRPATGWRSGRSAVSDNTRALNTSACRVANFRTGGGSGGGGRRWRWRRRRRRTGLEELGDAAGRHHGAARVPGDW